MFIVALPTFFDCSPLYNTRHYRQCILCVCYTAGFTALRRTHSSREEPCEAFTLLCK
jgi:hypothetical protein